LKYMWCGPTSLGKVLYFILRYVLPAYMIVIFVVYSHVASSVPVCRGIAFYAVWATPILQIPSMIVQTLRLYAIWSKNRVILILTITAAILSMTAYIISAGLETHIESNNFTNNIVAQTFGCRFSSLSSNPQHLQKVIIAEWMSTAAFETVILTFLLPRYITYKWKPKDVMSVLLRDGFIYYLIMLINAIGNAILTFIVPESRQVLFLLLFPWEMSTQSIVMSHMLLNVKEAADNLEPKLGTTAPNDFLTSHRVTTMAWNTNTNDISSASSSSSAGPSSYEVEEPGWQREESSA